MRITLEFNEKLSQLLEFIPEDILPLIIAELTEEAILNRIDSAIGKEDSSTTELIQLLKSGGISLQSNSTEVEYTEEVQPAITEEDFNVDFGDLADLMK